MLRLFVTGTDTDVGKTYISSQILQFFTKQGYKTTVMKPVSYGCYEYKGMLIHEDAELLQKYSSVTLPYDQINPCRFKEVAVAQTDDVTSKLLLEKYKELSAHKSDFLLVEGAGGWCCPISNRETMADFVDKADLLVILVVKIKLGCLNHAILTVENMLSRKVKVAGWIANSHEASAEILEQNINTLKEHLKIPFLGRLGSNAEIQDGTELADGLDGLRKTSFSA